MNKKLELVAYFDKKQLSTGLYISFFVTTIGFGFLFYLYCYKNLFDLLGLVLMIIFGGIILLFFIVFCFNLVQLQNTDPLLILNSKGMWLRFYGHVPWHAVEKIEPYFIKEHHRQFGSAQQLGVRFVASSLPSIRKQATLSGKIGLFWPWLLGHEHHVLLSCLTASSDEILAFAKQFKD